MMCPVGVRVVVVALAALAVAGCSGPSAPATPRQPAPGTTREPALGTPRASSPATPRAPDPTAPSPAADAFRPTGPTETATVERVVDGDTIVVIVAGVEERVRYIGVDTPERDEHFHRGSTRENALLLGDGRVVLEKDVRERDRYGRLLRHVWVVRDDRWLLVNLELVRRGFAQVSTHPPDVKYVDRLLDAERRARKEERGLWGPQAARDRARAGRSATGPWRSAQAVRRSDSQIWYAPKAMTAMPP